MKYYIAGSNQQIARAVRDKVRDAGHEVLARWLDRTFTRTSKMGNAERMLIARECRDDVLAADALILLAETDGSFVPGGKFVEAGIALGHGKPVYCIGLRENLLLWLPQSHLYEDLDSFLAVLRNFAPGAFGTGAGLGGPSGWPYSPPDLHCKCGGGCACKPL